MKKIRILSILPSIHLYGKERSNIEVYNILSKNSNVKLTILANKAASNELDDYINLFHNYKFKFPQRDYASFRILRYSIEAVISNIKFLIYLIKIKPQIIFINNEMTFYDFFLPLWLTKAKIIYRIGDIPAYPNLMGYKLNSFIWKKLIVKKTDTIISISNFIKNEINKTGRNCNKDKVIYNYPPHRISPSTDESSKYIKNNLNITFGYLGQIRELKGVHMFLDAAIRILEKNDNSLFYIAGSLSLDSNYSKKLLENKSIKNQSKIIFLEEIKDVNMFFKNIDILCVPTIWPEALGNVLVEAKSNRTPCIIFPSGGMPELITHMKDGYICNRVDSADMEKGINFYIDNPDLIISHSENSFNSLKNLGITYDKFVKEWNNAFNI